MSYLYCHKNGVSLRKLEEKDLPAMKELKDESWYGTTHITIVNEYDQFRWFKKMSEDPNELWMIAAGMGFDPAGVYKIKGIDWLNRSYESGHDIMSYARGIGLSKLVLEAGVDFGFEMLNMHRLDAMLLDGNRSLHAAMYAGFHIEGRKRRAFYKNCDWIDCVTLGLLREEWLELPRVKAYDGICHTNKVLGRDL